MKKADNRTRNSQSQSKGVPFKMNPVLKIVLRIIHYFSIVGTVLFTIFAFYEKMVGIEKAEALLEKLNISIF